MKSNTQKCRSKTQDVQTQLRGRIVGGHYRPGDRLPTFDEMESEFGVSRMVIQQAVGRLRGDGFVRSSNRKGLFVSNTPPHLCRVALLFADEPESTGWSRMSTALLNETKRLERDHPDWEFKVFAGMIGGQSSEVRLAELEADVRAHRIAGVIFTPKTFGLHARPVFSDATVPQAFLCAPASQNESAVVGVDTNALYRRALGRLVEKGRKRIAILHMADTTQDVDHAALFAAFGLKLHRPWIQWIGRSHPQFAENLVTLLLDAPIKTRPDGLIIADDNLIEHAAAGIVATGLRVGHDLDVIAHCNWPWPLPSVLPMERIGFDATDILRRAIESIVAQQSGRKHLSIESVPPLFEWEVKPPTRLPSPKQSRKPH